MTGALTPEDVHALARALAQPLLVASLVAAVWGLFLELTR